MFRFQLSRGAILISRYTRPEMGIIWTDESRWQCLLEVEIAVAKVQSDFDLIPKEAARDIKEKSRFDLNRINEIEKKTKHDVIAFVSAVAENVGENGRFLHYGLTSSDVLDTGLSLQILKASRVLDESFNNFLKALKQIINNHAKTLCAGRTHGMHAEPTTFGLKMAGHFAEFRRAQDRVRSAIKQISIGKLSGAVGTYSFLNPEIESQVCRDLGLKPETVSTQVIPRDRHAEVFTSLAFLGGALERLCIELRHLQRTEVAEVVEGFTPGQKGSSAMPHKKNPISSENITGCARLLRSNAIAALENIALWHERDISHSSVERVTFPDSFILADYALDRMTKVLTGLFVDKEKMLENIKLSRGQLFSSHVLLHLVDKGFSREKAYEHVQRLSHGLTLDENLQQKITSDPELSKYFSETELQEIFSGQRHIKNISKIINNCLEV